MSAHDYHIHLSEEQKELMMVSSANAIKVTVAELDELRKVLNELYSLKSSLGLDEYSTTTLPQLERVGEYRMLIGLVYLDMVTATRIYLNAMFKYEAVYSAKQLVVIINEGYKKIYHYSPNGIHSSFWVKDIGKMVESHYPKLKAEYYDLTRNLELFNTKCDETMNIKELRQLSVHYDSEPSKVYDMLVSFDIPKLYDIVLLFLDILHWMFEFTMMLVKAIREETKKKTHL